MSRSAMGAMRRCARSRVRARLKARQQLKAVLLRHGHRCSGRSSWMQAHERSVCGILERLESKGLVTSRLGEATPQRGGRAKRYFAHMPTAVAKCARPSGRSKRSGRVFP